MTTSEFLERQIEQKIKKITQRGKRLFKNKAHRGHTGEYGRRILIGDVSTSPRLHATKGWR